MRKRYHYLFLSCFIAFIALVFNIAKADDVIYINDTLTNRNITTHVEHAKGYEKASWPWDINENDWHKHHAETLSFLSSDNSYTDWYRFTVNNKSGQTQRLVLQINNSFLSIVDFFVINSRGATEKVIYTGLDRGLASKPIPAGNFVFPITIKNKDVNQIYFKVKSHFNSTPEIKLIDQNIYNRVDAIEKIVNGMISGILVLVCLYSIVMFLFIREVRFVYYALFTSSLTVCMWLTGSYMTVLSRIISEFHIINIFIVSNFAMQLGLLLLISEVIYSKFSRRTLVTIISFSILLISFAVASWFIPVSMSLHLIIVSLVLMLLWAVSLLVVALKQNDLIHFGYVCSLICFLIGCAIPFLSLEGILNGDIYTKATFFVVSISAGMVVSIALGYRTYQEKMNRIKLVKGAKLRNLRYIKMINFASEGMFIISVEGEIKHLNPAFCKLLGYENLSALNARRIYSFQSLCVDPREFEMLVSSLLTKNTSKQNSNNNKRSFTLNFQILDEYDEIITVKREMLLKHATGENILVQLSIHISEEMTGGFVIEGEAVDLSRNENIRNQLDFVSNHDETTGAYNRRYMMTALEELYKIRQSQSQVNGRDYLTFIRVGNFKYINEASGYKVADNLLKSIVNYLKDHVKEGFDVIKLNRDEFAVLMRDVFIDEVLSYIEQWRDNLSHIRYKWNGHIYNIVVNFGLVDVVLGENSVSNLLSYADTACNIAREVGPNTIHIYRHSDSKLVYYKEAMLKNTEILRAIDSNFAYAVTQKIENTKTSNSEIKQHFISPRIKTSNDQIITPLEFIGEKDEFNIMPTIDEWLINGLVATFMQNQEFRDSSDRFFITLSYSTICDISIQNQIFSLLKNSHGFASKLCIILDEYQISFHKKVVTDFMMNLKKLNVSFCLGNFGVGSSSYVLLTQLPFDSVCVCPKFVDNICDNKSHRIFVKALCELGHDLKKDIFVSNVSSLEEYQLLQSINVDYCFGKYFTSTQLFEFVNKRTSIISSEELK